MSDYLDINNEELLKDFFAEAEQQVEQLESNVLVIEGDPANHDAIDEIFRAAHTLKGGSAAVEMTEITGFTHAVEDLLDAIRGGQVKVSAPIVDALLSSIDVIKAMLDARAGGSVYGEDVSPIKETLGSFVPRKGGKKAASRAAAKAPPAPKTAPDDAGTPLPGEGLTEEEAAELAEAGNGEPLWGITAVFDESNPMNTVGGIQVFASLKALGSVLKTVPDFDALYGDEFFPRVVYYVASKESGEALKRGAFKPDVTLSVEARRIDPGRVSAPAGPPDAAAPEAPQGEAESAGAEGPEAPTPAKGGEPPKKAPQAQQQGSVLRVDAKRIDALLNLVSETVITKAAFNQIASSVSEMQTKLQRLNAEYKENLHGVVEQFPAYIESLKHGKTLREIQEALHGEFKPVMESFDTFESGFKSTTAKFRSSTQNLGRITGELQEGVMKIRMVSVNQIFSRFPRVVRDLSRDLDKKINLVIEGEDTELDKSVIEDLLDPIMHCVRNSIDHGIESPRERSGAGKAEEGALLLRAGNEGNMIVIDVIDDGRGIDVARVRAKAVERGIIHPDKFLSDQEAYQLIFQPGFSTAEKISNISGRGVGLDVVKTQIEKLNGSVTVMSESGKGTRFSIRLPLTLAIIQGLLVRVGKEVYSIPIASVIESHRVKTTDIRTIDNYEVLNVRDEIISVLRLSRLFGIPVTQTGEDCFIVIVGTADKKLGVMVDALIGEEDVVIKPLRDQFTNSPGIAGASILGDGSVSLIIDVNQLLALGVRLEIDARQTALAGTR
ncbi:MAG: chemotaxis protein CheA [Spirochaetaceae bacterium]|nr:chemotaxis protein CheA [Spirochaetaceae bacterium]